MEKIRCRNMTSVYFVKDDKVLCLYRIGSKVADKLYVGAAGGHFEKDELNDSEACVRREIREELGLGPEDFCDLALRYVTQRLMSGELRQNYYFFAKLNREEPLKSTEGILRWVAREEFPDLPMPLTAKHMMMHYLEIGRDTDAVYAGITEEAGTHFIPLKEF